MKRLLLILSLLTVMGINSHTDNSTSNEYHTPSKVQQSVERVIASAARAVNTLGN